MPPFRLGFHVSSKEGLPPNPESDTSLRATDKSWVWGDLQGDRGLGFRDWGIYIYTHIGI